MDSSPSDQATLFESRSASFTTTSDLARRLRSLLTPPRTRRSPDCTSSSARSSPTHLSRATIATSAPATRKTVMGWDVPAKKSLKQCRSCDDVGRLEHIFEPRMAPYTPPNNVFSKPNSEDASPIEQQRLEKLEFTLFEPRNAPCTPPLVRRVANSDGLSSSHSDLTVRPASVTDEPTQQQPISAPVESLKPTVEQLQTIMSDLRARAEESSANCAKQIQSDTDSQISLLTVREVEKIASVGSTQNFQRSFSGRSHANRFLALAPRARSVTVC
eukprot:scpid48080/ scgid21918/ 